MNIKNKLISQSFEKFALASIGIAGVSSLAIKSNKNETKTTKENLDLLELSPTTLSNKAMINNHIEDKNFISPWNNEDEVEIELSNVNSEYKINNDIDYTYYEPINDLKHLNNLLKKIKNPHAQKAMVNLFNNDVLAQPTIDLILDLEANRVPIKNKYVIGKINNKYDEIANLKDDEENDIISGLIEKLDEINQIINTYNTISGNYVIYRDVYRHNPFSNNTLRPSDTQKYLEEAKNQDSVIHENKSLNYEIKQYFKDNNFSPYGSDFELMQKLEAFEKLENGELKDYFYNLYINNLDIPKNAKEICKSIKENYNVMVLPSGEGFELHAGLKFIKKELEAWVQASKGKAILPSTININRTYIRFLKNIIGTCDTHKNSVYLADGKLETLHHALRHEIMHANDKKLINIHKLDKESDQLLDEIMPTKIVNNKRVRDFDNCKYREEFLNAGISKEHLIKYAYKNRGEFLAVAAQGDLSRYSQEFKEVLIKLGMPEYVFNLKTINPETIENCKKIDEIKKENPELSNYEELLLLLQFSNVHDEKTLFEFLITKAFS